MEIALPNTVPNQYLDMADLQPGMVRILRREENAKSVTIARSKEILDAGVQLMPCIHTDGWSNIATFQTYLTDWIEALDGEPNEPLWWEVGNEPGGTLTNPPSQATIRLNFLTYLNSASTILRSYGKKVIMAAITGAAGGTSLVLDDINGGGAPAAGVTFADLDAVAVHSYNWGVTSADLGSLNPAIYNNTEDSVQGFRNLFDNHSHTGGALDGCPIFITETGFSCATNASGVESGWAGQVPEQPTGTNAGGRRDVRITQAQHANYLANTMTVMASHRDAWNLRSCLWFAGQDYNQPSSAYDHHTGLLDINGLKRNAYTTLKNFQRHFPLA
jgi:hypothetical protein